MVIKNSARVLGSEIPALVLALSPRLSYFTHRFLDSLCLTIFLRPERLLQHDASRAFDAVGAGLYPQSSLRQATGIRVDSK